MQLTSLKHMTVVALAGTFVLLPLGVAGCGGSFCAGSGCDAGKIYFGSNYKQSNSGGGISVVGRSSTFKLGQSVAMVANLTENAGTKTLTLRTSQNGRVHAVPYHVGSGKSNVFANVFTSSALAVLGVNSAGTYTFQLLRGSKQLAKGSMTEK